MMKFNKKFVGVILALAMLFSLFAVNVAADGTDASTSVSTVEIYLDHSTVLYGATGSFEIATDDGVSVEVVSFDSVGSLSMMFVDKNARKFASPAYLTAATFKLKLVLTISGEVGQTATVTFNYNYMDVAGGAEKTDGVKTVTLEIVDYTALNAALAEFDGLIPAEYTNATWAVAKSAADAARALVGRSYNQAEVDAATAALDEAMGKLAKLKVDYRALEDMIAKAKALNADEYTASTWAAFVPVLAEAEDFLARKNAQAQSEIDAVVTKLDNAIKALVKLTIPDLDDIFNQGFEEGKNSVTIPDTDDIYNQGFEAGKNSVTIPADRYDEGYDAGYDKGYEEGYQKGLADGKKETNDTDDGEETTTPVVDDKTPVVEQKSATVWIVLFIVFLTTTLGLAGYVVFTLVIKKKKETDDTPVVDYNIEDDAE